MTQRHKATKPPRHKDTSKKLVAWCLGVMVTLLLVGCGNDQYAIERQAWQAQKQAEKIFKNPQASPPKELERVVNLLNSFVKDHPNTNFAIICEFNIARLYIAKEEYNQARTQLKTILNKYSKSERICSEAIFLTGNAYEIEGNWDAALEEYHKIMRVYPITPQGINIPIYIAQHYKVKYQPDKMVNAFQQAISHYQALAGKYPNSVLAVVADSLVAQCYTELKDWQSAVNTLNSIIERYKDKIKMDEILLNLAFIYNKELKDKVKAREALEKLIKDYPKSKLVTTANALLKELQ